MKSDSEFYEIPCKLCGKKPYPGTMCAIPKLTHAALHTTSSLILNQTHQKGQ